jgi:8-oxo-dGTP diphosphatase
MNTKKISTPLVAVDTLIFTVRENHLAVLLIKIKSGPYKGKWALPGGLVNGKESLDDAIVES